MSSGFRLPNETQRLTIIGSTGSGKTRFGTWALSEAPFHKQPYIIIDYKRDDLIGQIERAKEISLRDKDIPKHPGLYVVRPVPKIHDRVVEHWLWSIWKKEHVGLFVDEGYMLPKDGAFDTILTQGRSKRIPVITCTQRPAWLSRFVFSEASFFSLFRLSDSEDVKETQRFVPKRHGKLDEPLQNYHSRYYDRDADALYHIKPVPDDDLILDRLHERLKPKRKVL